MVSAKASKPTILDSIPFSFIVAQAHPASIPTAVVSPILDMPFYAGERTAKPHPLSEQTSVAVPFTHLLKLTFGSYVSTADGVFSEELSVPVYILTRAKARVVSPPRSSNADSYSMDYYVVQSKLTSNLSVLLVTAVVYAFTTFT